jgi:2-aminoadipate transaminase
LIELSAGMAPGSHYLGPVVYLGTLSKALVPGLRVGWLIGEPKVIDALKAAKQGADLCSNGIAQRIAVAALQNGLIERLSPQIVTLYRERRDALAAAMSKYLTPWFDWEVPVGGMFIWGTAHDPSLDTDQLVSAGLEAGVLIGPGSAFDPLGQDRSSIRLNFTANSPERLDEAIKRLSRAVAALRSVDTTKRHPPSNAA